MGCAKIQWNFEYFLSNFLVAKNFETPPLKSISNINSYFSNNFNGIFGKWIFDIIVVIEIKCFVQ